MNGFGRLFAGVAAGLIDAAEVKSKNKKVE
jgi:hypothetical protein